MSPVENEGIHEHFARKADDHVMFVAPPIDRDAAECGAFDCHGAIYSFDPIPSGVRFPVPDRASFAAIA